MSHSSIQNNFILSKFFFHLTLKPLTLKQGEKLAQTLIRKLFANFNAYFNCPCLVSFIVFKTKS